VKGKETGERGAIIDNIKYYHNIKQYHVRKRVTRARHPSCTISYRLLNVLITTKCVLSLLAELHDAVNVLQYVEA
jgi:hypothetical protein